MSDKAEADSMVAARRKFLASCGRFAIVTPPAVALMLSASKQSFAVAASGGTQGGGKGGGIDYRHHRRHARRNGKGKGD